ncbi:MAG TPA: pullulanase-associated domain-containing protein, partial [Albitalea sp.]|nr:pullulanase-associated domain-containing protein [Albitalea sp.]
MRASLDRRGLRAGLWAWALAGAALLAACGGGGTAPATADAQISDSTGFQTVLSAVPVAPAASKRGALAAKALAVASATPDLTAIRVHYRRFDGNYAAWGVHIWDGSGLDVAGLKPGVVIGQWSSPVPFGDFNNAST